MKNILLNNPVVYLWRKMYFYAKDRRKNIKIATTLFVFANIADASQPLVFGLLLNFIQKNGITKENLTHLFLILLLFLASEIVFWAFWAPARIIEQKTAFMAKKNYKEYLLNGVMAFPLSWHTDHHSGNTIDKIEKGTNSLFSFSEDSFMFIQAVVRLVISLGALIYLDFFASLVVIVVSSFIFYVMFVYDKKLIPGYKIVNRMENGISAKVYDVISNITTVIILRVENLVFKTISSSIDTPFPQFKKNIVNNEMKWLWAAILGQLSVIITISIYLFSNLSKGNIILVGSVYILYSYAFKVRETFFSFAQLYNNAVRWRSNIANAEEISKDFIDAKLSKNKHLPKNWSTLSIKNLSFSYHDESDADLHLDNININLKKGEKIAVIGESGGGKTTFLKLFRGLYLPKNINLEIDNKEFAEDFNLISESISLIPQDPEIFSTTIKENITLGVNYKESELKIFTDMASLTEVISRLPKGLESSIVEKGVNLSGGEKQRLALARGLLASKDKDIILLDEPTSSVDFHNELKIYENIFSALPDKTIISSIHRLHLLPLFDNIFFFKDGKIVAEGNIDELKEKSKDFKKLWAKYLKTQNQ
ncbi:MAG: ABC transporter ATP-binding protein [Candidatus Nomurabacteria bacterium]|nr:ABC transporter ATP-binding protein [Candidatus Nomurabacteria bacterium]